MRVAVLSERRGGEARVALVPEALKPLMELGVNVVVETGAGHRASFSDEDYVKAGAKIAAGPAEALAVADVLVRVQPPSTEGPDEVAPLVEGQVLIGFLSPLDDPILVRRLADARVTSLAMELIPRITRAQKMDALSSQATAAGYRAALIGANTLGKFIPMLMTAAGTIRPAKVLVLGAGVAGLQAIATARRLGAEVEAFDVRPAVKEQIESLGARFLEAGPDADAEANAAETEGGYARELSEVEREDELLLIANHVPEADIVITTARIPGRPAPVLVTEEMIRTMKPGSVIVDLASESGGNCVLSRPGESVEHHGVQVLGPVDLPATLPIHASQMYARNVTALLLELLKDGEIALDFDDEIVAGCCVTHGGEIRHQGVREHLAREAAGGGATDGKHAPENPVVGREPRG